MKAEDRIFLRISEEDKAAAKARAEELDMSLSSYIIKLIRDDARKPNTDLLFESDGAKYILERKGNRLQVSDSFKETIRQCVKDVLKEQEEENS